jgi:oligoribonuclease NrnB/cAMP/cGMP phosphodiesterase (DHH superfamily)
MIYKPDICFYHSPCSDGFGAAYAIWHRWPDIEFIPINHGEPINSGTIRGKNVLFVDFSLKKDKIWAMAQLAKSVIILDHHKSAESELKDFGTFNGELIDLEDILSYEHNNVVAHFDMLHSGAVLAWRFANPLEEIPQALLYIEDRDLWKWELSGSKEFGLATASIPFIFETWRDNVISNNDTHDLVRRGAAVVEYEDKLVRQIVGNAYWDTLWYVRENGNRDGHVAIFCNTSVLQSEVGNALIKAYPEAQFAAVWYITAEGETRYSLRSEEGRADVSIIASRHGGGGHRNASGFTVERQ